MKAVLVQMDAAMADPADREALMMEAVEKAKSDGADVVVFPELAVTGYGAGPRITKTAMAAEEAATAWQEAADRTGVAIVLGLAVREGGGLLNAAACLRPGEEPIIYGKRVLYGDYEKTIFTAGRLPSPVFEIAGMRCGLLVCFDVEFPELVRDLSLRGAEAILVPTALPRGESARFIAEKLISVRAFENQIFLVYAGHCGADRRFAYQGQSIIVAPDGTTLAQAGETEPAMLSAELTVEPFEESRKQNPYLKEISALAG